MERSRHVALERSVQRAFESGVAEWLLSNVYLAAQLIVATFRTHWAKALALMWGPLVTASVVATGNHYLFDVAAGLFVTGLAYGAVRWSPRPRLLRPRRNAPRRLRDEVMSVV